jgi:hypothetical protein
MKWTFTALFGIGQNPAQLPVAATPQPTSLPVRAGSSHNDLPEPAATGSYRQLPAATGSEIVFSERSWFLPTQLAWINDTDPLRLWEKGRQTGATRADAFDSVMKASPAGAKFDVWVTSRHELQATLPRRL